MIGLWTYFQFEELRGGPLCPDYGNEYKSLFLLRLSCRPYTTKAF